MMGRDVTDQLTEGKGWPVGLRFQPRDVVSVLRGQFKGKVGAICGVIVTANPTKIYYTVELGNEQISVDSRCITAIK